MRWAYLVCEIRTSKLFYKLLPMYFLRYILTQKFSEWKLYQITSWQQFWEYKSYLYSASQKKIWVQWLTFYQWDLFSLSRVDWHKRFCFLYQESFLPTQTESIDYDNTVEWLTFQCSLFTHGWHTFYFMPSRFTHDVLSHLTHWKSNG